MSSTQSQLNIKSETLNGHTIKYWLYGRHPRLSIHSGTHGDESGVIESVKKAVHKHLSQLPDFFYVPEVSPSGVARNTRENHTLTDPNRSFLDHTTDPEIILNQQIALRYPTQININFHEDPEQGSAFYLYDGYGNSLEQTTDCVDNLRAHLTQNNIPLFSGIDDPDDPVLGNQIDDGYFHFAPTTFSANDGTWASWGISKKVFERLLIPEVPTHLTQTQKDLTVDLIFQDIVLPLFRS